MEGQTVNPQWPNALRVLFIGNGVVNNLVEPSIQLTELEKEIPQLCQWLSIMPEELRNLAIEEIKRQVEYLTMFSKRLNQVLLSLGTVEDLGGRGRE